MTLGIKACLAVIGVMLFLYGLTYVSPMLPLRHLSILPDAEEYSAFALEELAQMAAMLHNVNPEIFVAQIRQESRFNQHAKSKAGAIGVAQIMPDTARGWKIDPHDPMQALDAAARNMANYVQTYKSQGHDERMAYKLALAAYNAGPGAVAKYKGVPPYPETQHYVNTILPEE